MSGVQIPSNSNYGYPDPGPQSPTGTDVTNSVFFVADEDWDAVRQDKYDYIVLGTGFCALAFVDRIYKKNPKAKILMLERGPFFLPVHFQNLPTAYEATIGGTSETFPWTLSKETATQSAGNIQFQHGMVPFFGGRSIQWSAWCPDPTDFKYTFQGFPAWFVSAFNRNKADAKQLMNVVSALDIDGDLSPEELRLVGQSRPVYGTMQRKMLDILSTNIKNVQMPSGTVVEFQAAQLAAHSRASAGVDFAKFSTPTPLLKIIADQQAAAAAGKGYPLRIVTNCVAINADQTGGRATVIHTSRGDVPIGAAKVILAMGVVPPTTFLMNSFPSIPYIGERYTSHFVTSVVGRIPRAAFSFDQALASMELGAIYISSANHIGGFGGYRQIHTQLSILSNDNPEQNAEIAGRYMPDVVATASRAQMESSKDHVLFVFASLGELNPTNSTMNYLQKNGGTDLTTNVDLQVLADSTDLSTWDEMDSMTFQVLEKALRPNGATVEYWHGDATNGTWKTEQPAIAQRRVPGLVHEASTLRTSQGSDAVVAGDYRPVGVENIYVTGGGLFPRAESWNPTLIMMTLAQDLADQLS